ncbi:hypothetical protein EDB89DRAFT_1907418 [Lactarius sanguifluus]|nr:hypothetical protein EDB89DRAFT_1907418 [Lactarius sanguifluus]
MSSLFPGFLIAFEHCRRRVHFVLALWVVFVVFGVASRLHCDIMPLWWRYTTDARHPTWSNTQTHADILGEASTAAMPENHTGSVGTVSHGTYGATQPTEMTPPGRTQVDSAKSTSCKGIWTPTPPAPSKLTQTPAAGVFDGQNPIPVHPTHERYNTQTIRELGKYFLHDHVVRESGHDTTYRLEKCCANLGMIDLQSLLYKYELNIATAIHKVFDDELELDECCDLAPSPVTWSVEVDASTHLPTNRIGVFLLEIDC